jgi:hypothetical protein
MSLVSILISAGGTSERMLRTCLEAIERHECETPYEIIVVAPVSQSEVAEKVCRDLELDWLFFDTKEDEMSGSRIHAEALDRAMPHVDTPYVLTLDADCFPMSAGWLDRLMRGIEIAGVVGIAHPYAPAPESMEKFGMEYRIRSQLCYDTPHVACMLISRDTLKRTGVGFADGDDTGLAIPARVRAMEMQVATIMPTACALPGGEFDRDMCVVYDDCIYHHGGGTREVQDKGTPTAEWDTVRKRIVNEGADFLIGGPVYKYKFDNEEEVADRMASRIIKGMQIYLQNNDRIFDQ